MYNSYNIKLTSELTKRIYRSAVISVPGLLMIFSNYTIVW